MTLSIPELRKKYPGHTFHDPPRGGLRFQCPECEATVWVPTSRLDRMNEIISFPHAPGCKSEDGHIRAQNIKEVTGSPIATTWDEEPV